MSTDLVFHKRYGLCRVERTEKKKVLKEVKLFYYLTRVNDESVKLWIPIDVFETQTRDVLSKKDVESALDDIPYIDDTLSTNYKTKFNQLNSLVDEGTPRQILGVLRYILKSDDVDGARKSGGIQIRTLETRCFEALVQEFANALDIDVKRTEKLIRRTVSDVS